MCRREFRFLVEDYGFTERELGEEGTINRTPFEVQYVSPKTSVLVLSQSYGTSFVVLFGPTETDAREIYPRYDLESLLQIRRPDLSLERIVGRVNWPDLPGQVRHYSRALQESAADVLRGDFAILPQVAEIRERRRKEFERQYYSHGFKDWKLSFQGCMARWRKMLRAKARRLLESETASCPYCGSPLRTSFAKQCRHCLRDWHDANNGLKLRDR